MGNGSSPSPLSVIPAEALDALDGTSYLADGAGVIRAVGWTNWNRFARDNDGDELTEPAAVIGRPLESFIAGEAVRETYRAHLERLRRRSVRVVVLPYHCDAPTVSRNMRMAVTAVHCGATIAGFLFQSITLAEDDRPPVDIFDFKALLAAMAEERSRPILALCAFCQRVRFPVDAAPADAQWISAEGYYRRGGSSRVRISHTVCPDCYDADKPGAAGLIG